MSFKSFAGAVLVFTFLAGCINIKQAQQPVDYYTLEYDSPFPTNSMALPFIIKIESFSTSPVYDSNRISYSQNKFQRSDYAYHKWRADPGDLVAVFLARDFSQGSLFKAVIFSETVSAYSHYMTGHIEEFYQNLGMDSSEAVLSVGITLSSLLPENNQNAVLFQKRYAYHERCLQPTPEGFVEAMSRAVKQLSADVMQDVYEELNKRR